MFQDEMKWVLLVDLGLVASTLAVLTVSKCV
jgi:hypothetical protein